MKKYNLHPLSNKEKRETNGGYISPFLGYYVAVAVIEVNSAIGNGISWLLKQ